MLWTLFFIFFSSGFSWAETNIVTADQLSGAETDIVNAELLSGTNILLAELQSGTVLEFLDINTEFQARVEIVNTAEEAGGNAETELGIDTEVQAGGNAETQVGLGFAEAHAEGEFIEAESGGEVAEGELGIDTEVQAGGNAETQVGLGIAEAEAGEVSEIQTGAVAQRGFAMEDSAQNLGLVEDSSQNLGLVTEGLISSGQNLDGLIPFANELVALSLEDQDRLIRTVKELMSSTKEEYVSADFAYLRCANELRSLLSQELPLFNRLQLAMGLGEVFSLSAPKNPESKIQYESILKSCEQNQHDYQQLRANYRQFQQNYLEILSLAEGKESKANAEKFKALDSQKEYIALLFRRMNSTIVLQSQLFWGTEYMKELEHLKNLDETSYNSFIEEITKKDWPVPKNYARFF